MQGRNRFTRSEADQIRTLLREKGRAARSQQKSIRGELRRLGFYITDFDASQEGFSVADFETLVRRGLVTIVESGITDHIDHLTAYERFPQKRMRNANPNGNIIVDANGHYNRLDADAHRDRFRQIREHYIVGHPREKRFLKPAHIRRLAPSFLDTLNDVFNSEATAFSM